MKSDRWVWAAALSLLATSALGQSPLGTAFTYQGQLKKQSVPFTDTADFRMSLWDAESGGAQVGATLALNAVSVANGLFTVVLDFGDAAFSGDARWLEIAVRSPAGGGAFETLSPRQELTPTPHALLARGLVLPYYASVASNVAAFKIRQTGPREAGVFEISNPASAMTALTGFTNGSGLALQAWNTGTGGTALFDIPNPANASDVVQSLTVGGGRAGYFEINNPANARAALHARTNSPLGNALVAENPSPAGNNNGAILANSQAGPGAEIVTQAAGKPALVATNMGGGVAVAANGRVQASGQIVSTLAADTAPFAVASNTLNANLNADMLDGYHAGVAAGMIPVSMGATCINLNADMLDNAHLTDLDNRFVNVNEANAIGPVMIQDNAVGADKLAHDIDATGIGFNAARVNGATIAMGTWNATNTAAFLSLHGGQCTLSGTGSHNDRIRVTNNLSSGEIRVTLSGHNDAFSSVSTVWPGTPVDVAYPHYVPFMLMISEAAGASNWTVVVWICENDGGGSYLALNHAQ